jgi:hypothetical protein
MRETRVSEMTDEAATGLNMIKWYNILYSDRAAVVSGACDHVTFDIVNSWGLGETEVGTVQQAAGLDCPTLPSPSHSSAFSFHPFTSTIVPSSPS